MMLSGRTTHAANHRSVQELNGDVETVARLKRASVDAPSPMITNRKAPKAASQPKVAPAPRDDQPWQVPLLATCREAGCSSPAWTAALWEAAQLSVAQGRGHRQLADA